MAYMNQEKKAKLAPKIKEVLKKYNIKGTLAVRNKMTLVLNIKSGSIDFIKNYNECMKDRYPYTNDLNLATDHLSVNTYRFHKQFTGTALEFLKEVHEAMNVGNHDRSDIQTDYFDVGWYTDINIGDWDCPYKLI